MLRFTEQSMFVNTAVNDSMFVDNAVNGSGEFVACCNHVLRFTEQFMFVKYCSK